MQVRGRVPNAEIKLDGAKFFMERLEENQDDPRAFYHYVSAVLSAARSVDYALRKEAGERYRRWFQTWQQRLQDDDRAFLEFLIVLRGDDVHGKRTPFLVTLDIPTIDADKTIAGFAGPGLHRADLAEIWEHLPEVVAETRAGGVEVLTYHFIRSGKPLDVLPACHRFVEVAARLLQDFRRAAR